MRLLFLLLAVLFFVSCKQDTNGKLDISAFQKNLDADPEVARLRDLLHSHNRLLLSIPQAEYDALLDKTHKCGFYSSTADMDELKSCIIGMPWEDTFLEYESQSRQYSAQYKKVEARFPDLSQLDNKKQAELLFPVNEEEAMKVLSDYSNRQK